MYPGDKNKKQTIKNKQTTTFENPFDRILYCFKNHKILFLRDKNRVKCEAIIFPHSVQPHEDSRGSCCHQFSADPERSTLIQSGKTFLGKDQFLEATNRLSSKKPLPCIKQEEMLEIQNPSAPRPGQEDSCL